MSDLHPMVLRIARVLGENPELAFEFYTMASEIVDDFEDYGESLMPDRHAAFGEEAAICRLRVARNELIALIDAKP